MISTRLRRIVGFAGMALAFASPPARGGDGPPYRVEALEMAAAILDGSGMMGAEHGWFHPGEAKYGWSWLAGRLDSDGDGVVTPGEFPGPPSDFTRLDRDRDRKIEAEDFDWSDGSVYLRQGQYFNYQFRRIDTDKNGLISRDEWNAHFTRIGEGRDDLTPDDLRQALTPPTTAPTPSILLRNAPPPDAPSKKMLLLGMLKGEVGSVFEGPRVGRIAPDFTLATRDGSRRVSLGDFRGKRPVVLVFGNVTCGPFRSRFGLVEDLNRRHGDRAEFLHVYVREAHPTDGWRMSDNDEAGIEAEQPTTIAGRTALADLCSQRLKTRMTMLVNGMDDRVGHLYSGMPSRLYVIDQDGRVAYQSGRGPFGFKTGELEQALLLTLLAESGPKPE